MVRHRHQISVQRRRLNFRRHSAVQHAQCVLGVTDARVGLDRLQPLPQAQQGRRKHCWSRYQP